MRNESLFAHFIMGCAVTVFIFIGVAFALDMQSDKSDEVVSAEKVPAVTAEQLGYKRICKVKGIDDGGYINIYMFTVASRTFMTTKYHTNSVSTIELK